MQEISVCVLKTFTTWDATLFLHYARECGYLRGLDFQDSYFSALLDSLVNSSYRFYKIRSREFKHFYVFSLVLERYICDKSCKSIIKTIRKQVSSFCCKMRVVSLFNTENFVKIFVLFFLE